MYWILNETYIVDDVLLGIVIIRVRRIYGTYYIHLIILERCVVLVHVDYMICVVYSKSATKNRKKFILIM